MKKKLIILFLIFFSSCTQLTPEQEIIKETLGRKVNIDMFSSVQYKTENIPFNEFREKYKYISLVYLQDNCDPCYPKYINWQYNMDSLNNLNNYTILFIINGDNFQNFLHKIKIYDPEYDLYMGHFYVVMDPDYKFLDNNSNFNRWAIDRSLLINEEDIVKLIGAPFSSARMKELFYNVLNS